MRARRAALHGARRDTARIRGRGADRAPRVSRRSRMRSDGISLIVPPASWKPPFSIELPKFRFGTRVQKINELFERNVVRVRFLTCLREFHDANGTPLTHIPALGGSEIDLFRLYNAVRSRGGYDKVCAERKWPAVARALHYEGLAHAAQALRACHQKLLLGYENLPDEARRGMLAEKAQRISERLQQVRARTHAAHRRVDPARHTCLARSLRPARADARAHPRASACTPGPLGWRALCTMCLTSARRPPARAGFRLAQEGIPTGSLMSSRAHMNAGPAGRKAGSMAEPVERSNAALDDKEVVIAYEPPIAGAEVCEVSARLSTARACRIAMQRRTVAVQRRTGAVQRRTVAVQRRTGAV